MYIYRMVCHIYMIYIYISIDRSRQALSKSHFTLLTDPWRAFQTQKNHTLTTHIRIINHRPIERVYNHVQVHVI